MTISINGSPLPKKPVTKKPKSGHTEPKSPTFPLDEPGHKVRIANFQWLMDGMSHSAFHARQRRGFIPQPDGRDPRPFWWTETVKVYLQGLVRRRWQKYPPG
jgi:hypothetical protein